ncbi:response regulator [Paenibacillus sp. sgz5001063]|uniref:response regulator n=1 Tax=Paenibacillus sp. sgz5001063 TaxID=3242474 RepID=UPI0036D22F41
MIELLLVDDESYVTESLARTIPWNVLGVQEVHQAASAMEALEILERQSIDIMVTDISMPGMDGLQLIEAATARWTNLRCLLLTGFSDFGYAKKAIQLQAIDYILKPVSDEEFIQSVSSAIESLRDEWEAHDKYHQLLYTRKGDFSVLRGKLMHDLLLGKQMSEQALVQKLRAYELGIEPGAESALLLVQLGRHYLTMDPDSISLMEYAIGNIAEEIFHSHFGVWFCKAPHDCLVLLVQPNKEAQREFLWTDPYESKRREWLEEAIRRFQGAVSSYLKGEISLTVTEWFVFPDGMTASYRSGLGSMVLSTPAESGTVVFLEEQHAAEPMAYKSLDSLYRPPTLIHLLESKQWEAVRGKLEEVFRDMEQTPFTREHLYELFLSITNAYMYIAHKSGQSMLQMNQLVFDPLLAQDLSSSGSRLRGWAFELLDRLQAELSESDQYAKSYIIKQVHSLVGSPSGHELSVKTIADQVYLHPVYLSKIYKAETGEALGDYIIRMRMERALYLLKHTNKKVYEITTELGYQNPQYFSKMFKKHYGMTPNEFREG